MSGLRAPGVKPLRIALARVALGGSQRIFVELVELGRHGCDSFKVGLRGGSRRLASTRCLL